ncbi:hypothetical protein HaLaN_21045, partial [Haematococcus lacustris]
MSGLKGWRVAHHAQG